MKLTTKSEYSLLALIYIARHEKKGFIKIEDICSEYELPRKYLEQLLLILRTSGLIRTKTGARGGYRLARPACEVSVAHVIRLMDGALAPTESVSHFFFSHTPLEREKKIIKVLKEIRDYVSNKLEKMTLADLI